MPVEIHNPPNGNLVEVKVSGRLHHSDYEQFAPAMKRLIDEGGKLRLLVLMEDFEGWDAGALWDDIKFDAKHFRDIDRLVLMGDKRWEHGMALFCKPFTTAEIRYLDRSREKEAREWLQR